MPVITVEKDDADNSGDYGAIDQSTLASIIAVMQVEKSLNPLVSR